MKIETLAILLCMTAALGQETRSTLSGTVTDSSGAAVIDAAISVVQTSTNLRLAARSRQDGQYVLSSLPPGPCEISVEAAGFRKFVRRGITLNAGDKVTVDVRLEVGTQSDSVTVTAELTGLETNQTVMGQVMDSKRVSELPLNGRSYIMLLQLSAGVVFTQQQFGAVGWSGTRQWETGPSAAPFSIHGSRPGTNAFLLDGAPQGVEGGVSYIPFADAIEEFKVVAPTSDASQGLSGGGVVSITMKSGTNQLHGLASEFLRNNIFDANTTQTNRAAAQSPYLKKQQHQWNNFSAMIGGPIIKNKFFYSGSYDGFRQRQPGPITTTVPTLAQRTGDFSQTLNSSGQLIVIYDPLTTRQQGNAFVRDAFAGNRLPAGRMPALSRNIMPYFPLPNIVTNPVTNFNNYAAAPNVGLYQYDSYHAKFDYLWSEKHRTFASVTQSWGIEYRQTNGFPRDNPGMTGGNPNGRQHAASTLDHVYSVNSTTVLNARLAWDRFIQINERRSAAAFEGAQLGFDGPAGSAPVTRFPALSFTDYANMANAPATTYSPNNVYTAVFDASKSLNRHLLKTGLRVSESRYNRISPGNQWGQFAFDRGFTQRDPQRADATSGQAMASFLLGYAASGGTDITPQSSYKNKLFGLYVQDDWRLNKRLTLNLGLRWDVQTSPTERYNRMIRGFDPRVTYQLGAAQAQGGFLFADKDNRQSWSTSRRDLQPRLGMAYQVTRKMVFRAGYGLSFLPVNGTGGAGSILQTGFSRTTPYVAVSGGGVNSYIPGLLGNSTFMRPFPNGILQPFGAGLGPKTQVGQAISFQDADYQVPRVHQMQAGFDFELPWKTTAEISYVGSRTRKFPVSRNLNAVPLAERVKGVADPTYLTTSVPNPFAGAPELTGTGLGAATVARSQVLLPFPQFGGVTDSTYSIGTTSYNSMEVKVQRRMRAGLALTVSYTLAKTLEAITYREAQYDAPSRGLADFDRTHHLTVIALYDLPIGRGKRVGSNWGRVFDTILGNWQYNIALEHMSGSPTALPDATPMGDPRLTGDQKSFDRWFNTCTMLTSGTRANCVSPAEPVAWVQLKPNELRTYGFRFPNLRNPWRPQFNMSLFKSFPVHERVRLELRAEAFNAFNTPMYGAPNTTLTSPQFGVITPDQINFSRDMQFALRIKF